jgi:predicted transcriptional regulator of viral defense system
MKLAQSIKLLTLSNRSLFTLGDVKKLLLIKKANTAYKFIQRLRKNGILQKLTKGKYQFLLSNPTDFEIANFLYSPSYISLETALNLHGILTQAPYEITLLTPLRNKTIEISGRRFVYLHITPKLYYGFQKEKNFLLATPEKALFDELYFISKGLRRLELDELILPGVNLKTLFGYARGLKNPKLKQLLMEIRKI